MAYGSSKSDGNEKFRMSIDNRKYRGYSDNAEEIYKRWKEAKQNVVAAVVTRRRSKEETVEIENESIKLNNEILETRQIKSTNEDISDIFSNLVEHYFEF